MFGKGVLELSSTFVWLSLGAISGLALKLHSFHHHQHVLAHHAAEGTKSGLTLYTRRTWLHMMARWRGQGRIVWHVLVGAGRESQSLKTVLSLCLSVCLENVFLSASSKMSRGDGARVLGLVWPPRKKNVLNVIYWCLTVGVECDSNIVEIN